MIIRIQHILFSKYLSNCQLVSCIFRFITINYQLIHKFKQNQMDFENLYAILPKHPQTWSIQDVSQWLNFINLQQYVLPFQEAAVDGSCINLIDNQILEKELGVTSSIIRKKLINWMNAGLHGYQNYLNSAFKMDEEQLEPQLVKSETSCLRNSLLIPNSSNNLYHSNEIEEQYQDQMIIQSFQGKNLGTHIVRPHQVLSVGYNKQNDIHSLQSTFHDRHAVIGHNGCHHYVKDLGSKHGTFLKVTHRTELSIGTIVEIGSFQFEVMKMNKKAMQMNLKCLMGELQENDQNVDQSNTKSGRIFCKKTGFLRVCLKESGKFTFGRRKENNFQKNDKHMSGLHCKIIFFNDKFYIEDFGSTNGTWIRISKEFQKSTQFPLDNGSIIKVGTTVTYLCRKNQRIMQQKVEVICRNCQKDQNNCLFYPCSHNIVCYSCSEYLSHCPQCKQAIEQKIKIHK